MPSVGWYFYLATEVAPASRYESLRAAPGFQPQSETESEILRFGRVGSHGTFEEALLDSKTSYRQEKPQRLLRAVPQPRNDEVYDRRVLGADIKKQCAELGRRADQVG